MIIEPSDNEQSWLAGLNPAQRGAVAILDGPLLVLSGAGTGKTRVLTARIAHLLATGAARPWNILAVTFTNKAAREMKQRVTAEIGQAADQVWFGTFHSLAARILRRHADLVGLTPQFTILDTDDQLRLLKQVMQAEGLDPKQLPPRVLLNMIGRWKDKGLTPDKITISPVDPSIFGDKAAALYQRYQARLTALNACDFGDLLLHNLTLFTEHPEILSHYHDRITHLLVDEYQDTNVTQYLWVRLLAQRSGNICCVGDDDQSIYGWRGAEIANMLRFEENFPTAKVIRLEENYRSTGHILRAASAVIAHNENRLGKDLYTSIDDGALVRVAGFWDGANEASDTARRISAAVIDGKTQYDDIAVLVRAGFQTREFEEQFIKMGVPYRVVGAKFYERQEIRDALAYLRVIAQPADDLAFARIINTPRRGIGATTIAAIQSHSLALGMPMLAAAESLITSPNISGGLKSGVRDKVAAIVNLFIHWRQAAVELSHTDLVQKVLDDSGYTAMWQAEKTPDAEGRLENLKELVSAMNSFESLADFLEHVSLVMDGDGRSSGGEVTLMTLHAAKGLEFDWVFLPGWEEGIFPSQRTLDENGNAGLEEERRLAYVGITRARQYLSISFATSRRVHGQWQSMIPSRFISELPQDSITHDMEQSMMRNLSKGMVFGGTLRPVRSIRDNSSDSIAVGDRVFHQKFGNGSVRLVDGIKLEISFDKAGCKKIAASFVELLKKRGI